jgi:hypothetical protein
VEVSLSRHVCRGGLDCANTGHSRGAWRTGKIDPIVRVPCRSGTGGEHQKAAVDRRRTRRQNRPFRKKSCERVHPSLCVHSKRASPTLGACGLFVACSSGLNTRRCENQPFWKATSVPSKVNARPKAKRTFKQVFLAKLSELSGGEQKVVNNRTLQGALEWQDERYTRIKDELVREKVIVATHGGPGGR